MGRFHSGFFFILFISFVGIFFTFYLLFAVLCVYQNYVLCYCFSFVQWLDGSASCFSFVGCFSGLEEVRKFDDGIV